MRKLLLLFIALLTGVSGVWAQTTVTIANCPDYTTNGTRPGMPSTYGSFSSKVFTTNAASGLAGVTINGSALNTFSEWYVNGNWYGECVQIVTAAASTTYRINLSAPSGYIITGYTIYGSGNTGKSPHTLTAENSESVVISAPSYNSPQKSKEFSVTGVNKQSTYFTIQTINYTEHGGSVIDESNTKGNTLYLPVFLVYVKPIIARPSARVTSISAATPYLIYNAQYATGAEADEPRSGFVGVDGTSVVKPNNVAPSTFRNYGGASVWELEATGTSGQYYAKNTGTGMYYKTGTLTTTPSQAICFNAFSSATSSISSSRNHDGTINESATSDTELWEIENIDQTGYSKYWNGNKSTFATWESSHPYAVYTIDFISPIYALSEINTGKAYNIMTKRGWWAVANDGTEVNSTNSSGLNLATSYSDSKQQFAFVEINSSYYLFSIKENKFVYVDGTKLSLSKEITAKVLASPVTLDVTTHADTKGTYPMLLKINGKIFGVHPSITPTVYNHESNNDEGNSTAIVEATDLPSTSSQAITLAKKKLNFKNTYSIPAANLDKVGFPSSTAKTTFEAAIDAIASNDDFDTDAATALATYKASVIYPEAGKVYKIKENAGTVLYAYSKKNDTTKPTMANGGTNTNNSYFRVTAIGTPVNNTATLTMVDLYGNPLRYSNEGGAVTYSTVTNETSSTATTIKTELFATGFEKTGQFYLGGAAWTTSSNKVDGSSGYNTLTNPYFLGKWTSYTNYGGCRWTFEEVDVSGMTAYTIILSGAPEEITLADGTILNNGTATVYLSEEPTFPNIDYYLYDLNIEGTTYTVTYEESTDYEALVVAYLTSERMTNFSMAGKVGYMKNSGDNFTSLRSLLMTFNNPSHVYTSDDYDNLIAYYEACAANVQLPENGKYYTLKNVSTNKYLNVKAGGRGNIWADLDNPTVASIIKPRINEEGTYLGSQGKELGWAWNSSVSYAAFLEDTGKKTQFTATVIGQLAFQVAYNNGEGGYDNTGYYQPNGDNIIVGGVKENAAAQWVFTEVSFFNIALNEVDGKSYATFCAPFDVTIGSGATAYTVKLIGNRAVYTSIADNKVPANTGVLIISETNQTSVSASINKSTAFDAISAEDNDLVGFNLAQTFSYPETNNTEWKLILGDSELTGIGFYKMNGTASGNKAYLPYTYTTGEVKGFCLVPNDKETGVYLIDNGQPTLDNAVYDLSGRRITKPSHGLYIVNGKKVLVK